MEVRQELTEFSAITIRWMVSRYMTAWLFNKDFLTSFDADTELQIASTDIYNGYQKLKSVF